MISILYIFSCFSSVIVLVAVVVPLVHVIGCFSMCVVFFVLFVVVAIY